MSKVIKKETQLFWKELQEIENQLINFFTEIGQIKWNTEIISKIAGYIYIYGSLTQKKLKILTRYSLSTISVNLNALTNLGLMKRLIPGTHTFEYYFPSDFNKSLSEASQSRYHEMKEIYKFIQDIQKELNLSKNQNKEGANFLSERLSQLRLIVNTFRDLVNTYKDKMIDTNNLMIDKNKLGLQSISAFTPEIIKIEKKVINFIISWTFLRRMGAPSPLIMGYFITRESLTQNDLRKITGLSIAKIYKELHQLLEFGLIQKIKESKSHIIFYSMKRIDVAFINYMIKNTKRILDWEDKLRKINFYLKNNRNQFQNSEMYRRIQHWVKLLFKLIRSYNKRLLFLESLKQKHKLGDA